MDENDVRNVKAYDLDGKDKKFSFQVNLLPFFDRLFQMFRDDTQTNESRSEKKAKQ